MLKSHEISYTLSVLSSTVHHIGLVVWTVTWFSSGTRWLEVETKPSKEDTSSSVDMSGSGDWIAGQAHINSILAL